MEVHARAPSRQTSPAGQVAPGKAGERPCAGVIRVLGGLELEFEGVKLEPAEWRRTHTRRLLQLLASAPDGVERRSRVQDLLWPEFDETRARNRLHHTIHLIRKNLEAVPETLRPQISVNADHLCLVMQVGTVVDAREFMRLVKADAPSAPRRLRDLEQATAWYRAPLAPDWDDLGDIAARRSWFEGLLDEALEEAADLAMQEGRAEEALAYAKRRAVMHMGEIEPQLAYAHLLVQQGRPEMALQHCSAARPAIAELDAKAATRLDEVARDIQKQTNQRAKGPPPKTETASRQGAVPPSLIAPQARPLVGYDDVVASALASLTDPFCKVVSLIGPPGSGKSALAAALVAQLRPEFEGGTLWIDCSNLSPTAHDLRSRVLTALGASCEVPTTALGPALVGRDLLLVLDGLEADPSQASALSDLLRLSPNIQWLVTAWSPPQIPGGRVVFVDPQRLLTPPQDGAPSFAAQLLSSQAAPQWGLSDQRHRTRPDALARACGGLPWLLEVVAQASNVFSPNELLTKLDGDSTALLRWADDHGGDQKAVQLARLVSWMGSIPEQERQLVVLMGACRGWLTRQDVVVLARGFLDGASELLDRCVRHQVVSRKVHSTAGHSWSEYSVPAFVRMTLGFRNELPSLSARHQFMEQWLLSARPCEGSSDPRGWDIGQWYSARIEDFEALIGEWQLTGQSDRIGRLCLAHEAGLSTLPSAHRLLVWLTSLGESMESLDEDLAAALLLQRASLRERSGSMHDAFNDAVRALQRVGSRGNPETKAQTLRMVERLGLATASSEPGLAESHRGAHAAEMLLHLAPLTARHGDLPKALLLCGEAAGILNYFGLKRGLVNAHQQRAKIAYAMGNLDLSASCLDLAERAAIAVSDECERARTRLMSCSLLYARSEFRQAIDTASTVLSDPWLAAQPALFTRAMLVLAWSHYAVRALPLAHAIASDLGSRLHRSPSMGARVSVATLTALIHARQNGSAGTHSIGAAFASVSTPRATDVDPQEGLINVAELAFLHERFDLCGRTLHALDRFVQQPDHRLRAYVGKRRDVLTTGLPGQGRPAPVFEPAPWHRVLDEVLTDLLRAGK